MASDSKHSPKDSFQTRPSLLLRLRDLRDQKSWDEFVELYGPLILRWLRRMDVPEQDAREVVQDVLLIVLQSIGTFEYDPKRGQFRGWLWTITHNRAMRVLQRAGRGPTSPGGSGPLQALAQTPADRNALEQFIEQDWQDRRLEMAVQRVAPKLKPTTWKSFAMRLFEGREPEEIAQQLGIRVGSVYTNISRVAAMLRQVVEEIDE